jgi:hypothetical protein
VTSLRRWHFAALTKQNVATIRHMTARNGRPLSGAERTRRWRERQHLGVAPPDDGPVLRDADDLLAPALETSLDALELTGADSGVAQLARGYARAMDEARDPAWAARWLGPELLKALESLGATPMARSRVGRQPEPPRGTPQLDALRAARAPRRPPGA